MVQSFSPVIELPNYNQFKRIPDGHQRLQKYIEIQVSCTLHLCHGLDRHGLGPSHCFNSLQVVRHGPDHLHNGKSFLPGGFESRASDEGQCSD